MVIVAWLAQPVAAQPELHQAWCQLVGVRVAYPPPWSDQLAAGPQLHLAPVGDRPALWGQWATSTNPVRCALAQNLRRQYLLAQPRPQIPWTPTAPPLQVPKLDSLEFDALVVGSGPAGSVLAYTLSQAGWKVALIEKGPFFLPGSCDPRAVPGFQDAAGARPSENGLLLIRNGQVTGGGSSVNVDLAFPPTLPFIESRMQAWRSRLAWPPSPESIQTAYTWVETALGTRPVEAHEINPNNNILWQGAQALGLQPSLYRLNTRPPGYPGVDKRSAVETFILPAIAQGLVLLPDSEVDSILVKNDKVEGVEIVARQPWTQPGIWRDPHQTGWSPGQRVQLKASRVYLCAGSLGSGLILQKSKLGGSWVGRGVILHPSFPLIGLFDRPIHADRGTPSSVYLADHALSQNLLYESMSGSPEYVSLLLPAVEPQLSELRHNFDYLGGFGVMLVDSVRWQNRVEPGPKIYYDLDPQDRSRLAQGVANAARMMLRAGARKIYLPTSEDLLGDGNPARGRLLEIRHEDQLARVARNLKFVPGMTLLTSAHMQSTCKTGEVVDAQGRVKGVTGLWVADSSVFPSSIGANPMQSIYTLARIFALQQVHDGLHRGSSYSSISDVITDLPSK